MAELIFLVGFPRSGTTFLATSLSRFEGVCSTPETHFYTDILESCFFPRRKIPVERISNEFSDRLRLRDLEIDFKLVGNNSNSTSKTNRVSFFRNVVDIYAKRNSAEIVVEKTPDHFRMIDQIRADFPESPIIVIVRNPVNVLLSLKKVPWATKSDIFYLLEWGYLHEKLCKSDKNVVLVHYEDLVEDWDRTLRKIDVKFLTGRKITDTPLGEAVPEWELQWKSNALGNTIVDKAKGSSEATPKLTVWVEKVVGDQMQKLGYNAQSTAFRYKLLVRAFGIYLWLRKLRKLMTYGLGLTSILPSERKLTKTINQQKI
ncbi:sulfotransferase family protein [Roseinatronobacter sp. NSM]|uniref:sulfotransferase family protein n=1 Tax=Roseinatronobacter sp. NSM TaxID=3457785 RepID=UPI004036008B